MDLNEIGAKIRDTREGMRLTQQQVAKAAGVSRLTVNQLENGKLNDIGLKKLSAIAEVLGLQVMLMTSFMNPGIWKNRWADMMENPKARDELKGVGKPDDDQSILMFLFRSSQIPPLQL